MPTTTENLDQMNKSKPTKSKPMKKKPTPFLDKYQKQKGMMK